VEKSLKTGGNTANNLLPTEELKLLTVFHYIPLFYSYFTQLFQRKLTTIKDLFSAVQNLSTGCVKPSIKRIVTI